MADYIRIISPKNGQYIKSATEFEIKWESSEAVNIYWRPHYKQPKIPITSGNDTGSYLWNVPEGSYTYASLYFELDSLPEVNESVLISIHKGDLFNPYYPKVLHGSGKPYFIFGDMSFEIDRPVAIIEKFIPEIIEHKLYNGKKRFICKGFWYEATLDFSNYISKETLMALGVFFDSTRQWYNGYGTPTIIFYPRHIDFYKGGNPKIFYNVEIDPESEIVIKQMAMRSGHRDFILKLKGVERLARIPLLPGDTLLTNEMSRALPYGSEEGYGTQYGENYGDSL